MSIKSNFTFNLLLSISQIVIPVFTFPYISRILEVDGVGTINYVESFTKYFLIFAVSGISIHGLRKIANYKDDKELLLQTFNEIFSIQIILTITASIIYLIFLLFLKDFNELKTFYIMGFFLILINVFSFEWVFQGLEDFKFIALRTIVLRLFFFVLTFLIIKSKNDVEFYFLFLLLFGIINGIINLHYISKIFKIKLIFNFNVLKNHLISIFKSTIYIFSVNIYILTPIILLGILNSKDSVGYYVTSTKIISLFLVVFSSLSTVLIPRLSKLVVNGDTKSFNEIIEKSIIFVLTFGFPIAFSLFLLAPEIINLFVGKGYLNSIICLQIMSPLIVMSPLTQIFATQILIPFSKDKQNIIAVTIGSFFCLILNFIFLKYFDERFASISFLISEIVIFIITLYFSKQYFDVKLSFKKIIELLIILIPFYFISLFSKNLNHNSLIIISIYALVSVIYFITIQLIFKNPILILMYNNIISFTLKKIKNK